MGKDGVFISHITEESALGTLVKDLVKKAFGNIKVFLSSDYESIGSGDIWFDTILKALKSSEAIIVLLSKESMHRPWINFEAGVGKGAEALVVPALVRGLMKAEVVTPLSHLQLRDFEDPNDVSGALKDIANNLDRSCNEVDVQSFVTRLKNAGSALPAKVVSLVPYLESRRPDGYVLKFTLSNTGNQNINLVCLEARVPKSILAPNWILSSDPAVVEPTTEDRNGLPYLRLRYTTYQGPPSYGKHHIKRLPSVLLTDTTLKLGLHFSFPIKPSLDEAEKTLSMYYRIGAQNVNFPLQTTTFNELLAPLTAASDENPQTKEPTGPMRPVPRETRPRDDWRFNNRDKDWYNELINNWFRR